MHINLCPLRILRAGRIQLAKVWHILSDLWNLQHVSKENSTYVSLFTFAFAKHRFRLAPEQCRKILFVYFASLASDIEAAVRVWVFWHLSIFTSKCKVDMLCNQSRGSWWSIKEKKEKQTKTKQSSSNKPENNNNNNNKNRVVLDTKWGTFHFLVFAFVLERVAFTLKITRFCHEALWKAAWGLFPSSKMLWYKNKMYH